MSHSLRLCPLSLLSAALLFAVSCTTSAGGSGAPAETDTGSEAPADTAADTLDDTTEAPRADTGNEAPTDTAGPPTTDTEPQTDTGTDIGTDVGTVAPPNPDLNGDGTLNILVLSSNTSIQSTEAAFSPQNIAYELQSILAGDAALDLAVNVVAEDIHQSKQLVTGYGQSGQEYTWMYYCQSLAQYYFWPEGREARIANLAGEGEVDWDQVIIGGDPHIVAALPGYYALGANLIASKVAEGGAQPLLLMLWPQNDSPETLAHFEEFTYRAGDGARVPLPVIPAGRAWGNLPAAQKDSATLHPSPNGAYLAAAAIYAHLRAESAATSDYVYDDDLAETALSTVVDEADKVHYAGPRTFISPFKSADITERVLEYNHTGSSSENGILGGLKWVLAQALVPLQSGGDPPIHFNYGRANTEFEPHKRYQIDPEQFQFSLGFPMQDHSSYGNTTMLYGLDKRRSNTENGTDLGVARKMVRDAELPTARAIPIRTLFALLKDAIPEQSAYSDGWHMNGDLDRAIGAYMYTLLTGHCALHAEPADPDSNEWRSWMAHKIGYETAWTLLHLRGSAPGFRVMPEAADSASVTLSESASLSISFVNPPSATVTVSLSTDNDTAVSYVPSELVFTPDNYDTPQEVTMLGLDGDLPAELYTITASTVSADPTFDGLADRWEYKVLR